MADVLTSVLMTVKLATSTRVDVVKVSRCSTTESHVLVSFTHLPLLTRDMMGWRSDGCFRCCLFLVYFTFDK